MPYYPAIHVPSSHNSNNIWREVQIMKLFIMLFHSLFYYFQMKSLNAMNSTIPIFSLQSLLKVTHQVSYTSIYKKYWVNMHTFVSQGHVFREQSKIKWSLLQIHFLSISWFCNLHFLLPLLNIWVVSQTFKMCNTELAGFRLWHFFCKSSDQMSPYSFCALQTKLSTAV